MRSSLHNIQQSLRDVRVCVLMCVCVRKTKQLFNGTAIAVQIDSRNFHIGWQPAAHSQQDVHALQPQSAMKTCCLTWSRDGGSMVGAEISDFFFLKHSLWFAVTTVTATGNWVTYYIRVCFNTLCSTLTRRLCECGNLKAAGSAVSVLS